MSRESADHVIVRCRLSLAAQVVTPASPEYDDVTGVITVKAINLFLLAPMTVKGFVWEAEAPVDPYDMPEIGDWITVAAFAKTSTVVIVSDNGSTVGFDVDGGASLTVASVDAATDTDALRDAFNTDEPYSAAGTATTLAPGYLRITWDAAWPTARVFTDLSTGAAVAAGNVDVVTMVSGSGDPPLGSELQGSHDGTVYIDPFARPVQLIYRDKTPDGADLNRWLVPDWSA